MKTTGKIITLFAGLSIVLASASFMNDNCIEGTHAFNDVQDAFGDELKTFLEGDLAPVKNSTAIGQYYKQGIMGHRRVVEFGDEINVNVYEVETYTDTESAGTLKELNITNKVSHEIGSKMSISEKIQLGTSSIIKAGLSYGNTASVGIEKGMTMEYTIGTEKSYWDVKIEETVISKTLSLDNLLDGHTRFRYSKVACYVEAKIKASYTQEQNMFGRWGKIGDTVKKNYTAKYYIGCMNTFVYPNETSFGNKEIGEFKVNGVLKTY